MGNRRACILEKSVEYSSVNSNSSLIFLWVYVRFVTFDRMNSSFGSIISLPSELSTRVYRMRKLLIVPVMPLLISITSPSLMTFSNARMMPLIKLDVIFCKPKPTPTPTALPIMAIVLESTPIVFSPMITTVMMMTRFRSLIAMLRV